MSWFEPHLKTIVICYYAIVLKEEKKQRKKWALKERLQKIAYCPTNKASVTNNRNVVFRITTNWMWPLIDDNKLQFDEKNKKN